MHGTGYGESTYPTVTSKMLLPTEEDTAMSPKPFLATMTLVMRSGMDVPAARNVSPMTCNTRRLVWSRCLPCTVCTPRSRRRARFRETVLHSQVQCSSFPGTQHALSRRPSTEPARIESACETQGRPTRTTAVCRERPTWGSQAPEHSRNLTSGGMVAVSPTRLAHHTIKYE